MREQGASNPLSGVSEDERHIMERLLRMRPEPHKDAPKPTGTRADAQRRRRERARPTPYGEGRLTIRLGKSEPERTAGVRRFVRSEGAAEATR